MAYTLYTQSFGSTRANYPVRIIEVSTGKPAIVLTSSTGGVSSDQGKATLDSNGNLSVYIDTARVWDIQVEEVAPTDQVVGQDTVFVKTKDLDTLVGVPGVTYVLNKAPYTRYITNGTKLVPAGAVGGNTVPFITTLSSSNFVGYAAGSPQTFWSMFCVSSSSGKVTIHNSSSANSPVLPSALGNGSTNGVAVSAGSAYHVGYGVDCPNGLYVEINGTATVIIHFG